eukprot:Phypoly_transcript_26262.p1 GENE.Phypoly_transcript_26262~~Phypoly_transcript_26262.p1  ORF type:complete len:125 (+),score=23.42 Phypoly_transcript_26262:69-443(+)
MKSPKRATKTQGGKKPAPAPAKKKAAPTETSEKPRAQESVNTQATHGIIQTVTELLRDCPPNSPLVITPLGRAQVNLSPLLSGQAISEQKCAVQFPKNILQKQNLTAATTDVETFINVHVTLNP